MPERSASGDKTSPARRALRSEPAAVASANFSAQRQPGAFVASLCRQRALTDCWGARVERPRDPMLTMKTRYALKAMEILTKHRDTGLMPTCELAERGAIPRKFLETILRELQQHGLLVAQRGPGGGYALRLEPREITLAAIISATNGPLSAAPCMSQPATGMCAGCSDEPCSVRLVMQELFDATSRVLQTMTLADLVRYSTRRSAGNGAEQIAYSI